MTGPRIGVDVGGTFTDVTLVTDSNLTTAKVPTSSDQSEGVLAGIRKACDAAGVVPSDIVEFVHATTVAVNALLERNGAKTALVTTDGFRDVLEIGRQTRPSLYDLDAEKPAPLVPRRRRFELDERSTTDGVETAVDDSEVRALIAELPDDAESVAVAFLHSYVHPENEQRVADHLRESLEIPISASHEVLAEFREFERTATTTADAYLTPTIDAYLGRLTERVQDAGIPEPRVMQSNGGIADAATVRQHAVTTVLSGPAAGVVGARRIGEGLSGDWADDADPSAGFVTFDMGGTSSDVSLIRDGEAERTTDTIIDGVPIRTPMVDVNTIGSGGGSIAWVDAGGALRVGPESAGADPGPACYGRGGDRATVTDANLVLGYIGADAKLGGELSLDAEAATDALASLAAEAELDSAREAARGVHQVANAKMTRAVREVTVERGYDPREFGLVAFGGAGPMHAPQLASALEIETVVVPLAGGVLSAFGLLDADEQYDAVVTHLAELSEVDRDSLMTRFDNLIAEVAESATFGEPTVQRSADLRYAGQSFELTVPVEDGFTLATLRERFHEAHERAYGYTIDEDIEIVNLRASARVERGVADTAYRGAGDPDQGTREADFDGTMHDTRVYERRALAPGRRIEGPAVVEDTESTAVVPPMWNGIVEDDGTLVLRREAP